MKKLMAIVMVVSFAELASGAAINVTNVVTITANTNVQATLKQWLDANTPGAGSNYIVRFNVAAGEQLTNWIKRVYREQVRLQADTDAQAQAQSNLLINPVGP